jgi:hypothetical protein
MLLKGLLSFLSSQLFSNILLLITVLVAFIIGWRQIYLNDVVELYAITSTKKVINVDNKSESLSVVIHIQNVGTRLVYLDKYIFNGSEYITNRQILPPTYSQSNASYWVDLPDIKINNHVSLIVYYHDLDDRYWKSEIVADFIDGAWKTSSLPRTKQ